MLYITYLLHNQFSNMSSLTLKWQYYGISLFTVMDIPTFKYMWKLSAVVAQ